MLAVTKASIEVWLLNEVKMNRLFIASGLPGEQVLLQMAENKFRFCVFNVSPKNDTFSSCTKTLLFYLV